MSIGICAIFMQECHLTNPCGHSYIPRGQLVRVLLKGDRTVTMNYNRRDLFDANSHLSSLPACERLNFHFPHLCDVVLRSTADYHKILTSAVVVVSTTHELLAVEREEAPFSVTETPTVDDIETLTRFAASLAVSMLVAQRLFVLTVLERLVPDEAALCRIAYSLFAAARRTSSFEPYLAYDTTPPTPFPGHPAYWIAITNALCVPGEQQDAMQAAFHDAIITNDLSDFVDDDRLPAYHHETVRRLFCRACETNTTPFVVRHLSAFNRVLQRPVDEWVAVNGYRESLDNEEELELVVARIGEGGDGTGRLVAEEMALLVLTVQKQHPPAPTLRRIIELLWDKSLFVGDLIKQLATKSRVEAGTLFAARPELRRLTQYKLFATPLTREIDLLALQKEVLNGDLHLAEAQRLVQLQQGTGRPLWLADRPLSPCPKPYFNVRLGLLSNNRSGAVLVLDEKAVARPRPHHNK